MDLSQQIRAENYPNLAILCHYKDTVGYIYDGFIEMTCTNDKEFNKKLVKACKANKIKRPLLAYQGMIFAIQP